MYTCIRCVQTHVHTLHMYVCMYIYTYEHGRMKPIINKQHRSHTTNNAYIYIYIYTHIDSNDNHAAREAHPLHRGDLANHCVLCYLDVGITVCYMLQALNVDTEIHYIYDSYIKCYPYMYMCVYTCVYIYIYIYLHTETINPQYFASSLFYYFNVEIKVHDILKARNVEIKICSILQALCF